MARNIEIKVRIDSVERWLPLSAALADSGPTEIAQDDTFFCCATGRLKLRAFSPTSGELIFYQRPDSAGPKESRYFITPVINPDQMRHVLTLALGQIGRVQKTRQLFLAGRTRIHLDRVETLGDFLELEVVLNENESNEAGIEVANELLSRLKIEKKNLIQGAYIDMVNCVPNSKQI